MWANLLRLCFPFMQIRTMTDNLAWTQTTHWDSFITIDTTQNSVIKSPCLKMEVSHSFTRTLPRQVKESAMFLFFFLSIIFILRYSIEFCETFPTPSSPDHHHQSHDKSTPICHHLNIRKMHVQSWFKPDPFSFSWKACSYKRHGNDEQGPMTSMHWNMGGQVTGSAVLPC